MVIPSSSLEITEKLLVGQWALPFGREDLCGCSTEQMVSQLCLGWDFSVAITSSRSKVIHGTSTTMGLKSLRCQQKKLGNM